MSAIPIGGIVDDAGIFHAPVYVWRSGWACACGAQSRHAFVSRDYAVLAWLRHALRHAS